LEPAISPEGQISLGSVIMEMPVVLFNAIIDSSWKQVKELLIYTENKMLNMQHMANMYNMSKMYVEYVMHCLELLHTAKQRLPCARNASS